MAERQSARPLASSENVLASALDVSSARRRTFSSSVSFKAAGENHANKVAELASFKNNFLSGEVSDGDTNDHVTGARLSASRRRRRLLGRCLFAREITRSGSVGADLHLMSIDEHLRVFFLHTIFEVYVCMCGQHLYTR